MADCYPGVLIAHKQTRQCRTESGIATRIANWPLRQLLPALLPDKIEESLQACEQDWSDVCKCMGRHRSWRRGWPRSFSAHSLKLACLGTTSNQNCSPYRTPGPDPAGLKLWEINRYRRTHG